MMFKDLFGDAADPENAANADNNDGQRTKRRRSPRELIPLWQLAQQQTDLINQNNTIDPEEAGEGTGDERYEREVEQYERVHGKGSAARDFPPPPPEGVDAPGGAPGATATTPESGRINPLPQFRVSSGFGPRVPPTAGASSYHKGMDVAAPKGTPLSASTDATVAYAGWSNGYGNVVILSHGSGVYSMYAHLDSSSVRTGQRVTAGTPIAKTGSSGVGTAAHLHYEVMVEKNGRAVNVNPGRYSIADLANAQVRDQAVAESARIMGNAQTSRVFGRVGSNIVAQEHGRTLNTETALAAARTPPREAPAHDHRDGDGHDHDRPAAPARQTAAAKPSPSTSREAFQPAAAPAGKPAEPGVLANVGNWLKAHIPNPFA